MVKSSGSPNYKLAEVARLLELVEDRLPLGMEKWKRLADAYNLSRVRGWAERDYDSLRRKLKALYGLRKPTDKLSKKALDERASVVEMNDAADKDGCADEEDDPEPLGDLCFDFEPEDVLTDEHAIVTPGGADKQEALRHPTLIDYSNRLGGTNLYTFRDTAGAKRALQEDDKDITEASYAKAKRTRAIKATTLLKDKFCSQEKFSSSMGSSMFEMMLMLREDSERKAETRRLEEDQRRRDAAQEKEERQRA
ncbi:hypothetical protein PInf_025632 [Phytophthora infestans]|nr:hypothetical protein PInf_025553 [Phytophthora infestans]KAI9986677.1 hypothetical protein PInf_025632 [Phytophthora infestans]